jgi:hypothetical protein
MYESEDDVEEVRETGKPSLSKMSQYKTARGPSALDHRVRGHGEYGKMSRTYFERSPGARE